jgi:hypothetical protein
VHAAFDAALRPDFAGLREAAVKPAIGATVIADFAAFRERRTPDRIGRRPSSGSAMRANRRPCNGA